MFGTSEGVFRSPTNPCAVKFVEWVLLLVVLALTFAFLLRAALDPRLKD